MSKDGFIELEMVASNGLVAVSLKNGTTLWSGFCPSAGGSLTVSVPMASSAEATQAVKPKPKHSQRPAVSPTATIMNLMGDGKTRTVQEIRKATKLRRQDIHGHIQYLRKKKMLVWRDRATYQKADAAAQA